MQIKRLASLSIGLLLAAGAAHAQTLFTYGGHPVTKEEFLRVYKKNSNMGAQDSTTIPEYLNLYALFRMKVQEALDQKLDTTTSFKRELNRYKGQLTRSELVDKAVTARLVKEAYQRLKKDVKVAHILIAVRPSEDSTRAKNLIDSLYQVLKKGDVSFATLAKKYSEDKSTSDEGGEIGYITALQTPYAFETAAYNTPKGQVSKPFRTLYGYDILKVQDVRQDPGKVKVAQILISCPSYKDEAAHEKALALAHSVVKQLKRGADFDALVKKYSGDRYTKDNNGVMPAFGIGKMTPDFQKAAFDLKKPGDISQPVATNYGYHIIKLIKKIPLPPYDSINEQLTMKVKKDAREAKAKKVYLAHIKEQYHFKNYPDNFQQLLTVISKDTSKRFLPSRYPQLTKTLFQLDGKQYSQSAFLTYAYNLTKGNYIGTKENALKDLYESYQNKILGDLQQQKLLATRPDLRNLIKEYKDGILLFDLMDKKVWNKASGDTTGLRTFYQEHKANYVWQPGFEGAVFYSTSKKALEKLQQLIDEGKDVELSRQEVNKEIPITASVSSNTGRFTFNQFPVAAATLKAGKASGIFHAKNKNKDFGMIYVGTLYPKTGIKSLSAARGFVVADYQNYLEKQWNITLKKKYPVKINEKVLQEIEKQHH